MALGAVLTCLVAQISGLDVVAHTTAGALGAEAVHLLEAALLAPHVVDLHGRLALRHQVQVLLGQVSPQLPDLKLTERQRENE